MFFKICSEESYCSALSSLIDIYVKKSIYKSIKCLTEIQSSEKNDCCILFELKVFYEKVKFMILRELHNWWKLTMK